MGRLVPRTLLTPLFTSILGLVWTCRHLNSYERAELDDHLEAGAPPLPPTRHRAFWEFEESSCFHLDGICSRIDDGWFYSPTGERNDANDARQPTIALIVNQEDITFSHGYKIDIEKRIQLNVSSTSHELYDDTCSFSPTPYHMVVQSAYSEMMGEFYARTILGLNRWMRDFPPPRLRSNDDLQMYVHFVAKQRLFEGHRLFLGGLPNNNEFDSFLSLMPNDSCRCYTKLIFCGYDVVKVTAGSLLSHTHNSTTADAENVTTASLTSHDSSTSVHDAETNVTVFKPRAQITNPKTWCAMKTDSRSLKTGNCAVYRKLRRDLFDTYLEKEPTLGEKIRQYQKRILTQKGLIKNSTLGIDDWKFVGLAHRKSRRKWLNIGEVMSMCDRKFAKHKIACVLIDVEQADSPEWQLLMHRSLHALVGVHGAQLTQGVLMPRHGHVLELLPWVPHYLWGGWVARMHAPTPLGIIFHETDLNHIGYPLGRDSVPLCMHVDPSDSDLERACLMNKTSGVIRKFQWAGRDFIAPAKVVEDFVASFLLNENDSICDVMRKRAERKGFVLYNAFCRKNVNETYIAKHFYRKQDADEPKNIHDHTWKKQQKARPSKT